MTETATIKLVQATKEDMMQLKENVALGDGKYKRVMEPRYGQVFKLKSMITGKFDDKFVKALEGFQKKNGIDAD